jgi:plastocyanin
MARRNLLRSLLTASLMATAGAVSALLPATPAGAADNNYTTVRVSDMAFTPDHVTVRSGDIVVFTLTPEATVQHTVTFEKNSVCSTNRDDTCERVFTEEQRSVGFRFLKSPGEDGVFEYYDRFAQAQGGNGMHGTVVVTDAPTTSTTLEPTSSTTVVQPSTTSTTRPVTTTTVAPTTSTSAPSTIHPFLIHEPVTTTTTTAPKPAGSTKNGGGSASAADKGKGKGKPASTETPTTAAPAPPEGLPGDRVFDPASLTPSPESMPGAATSDPGTVEELDAATIALLHQDESSSDDGTRLVLIVTAGLGLVVLGGATLAWYGRNSRYFPA